MLRFFAYLWAGPVTLVGLLFALKALMTGGRLGFRDGVVEATGGLPGWLLRGNGFWRGGAAMTLGHVIIARDHECLEQSRPHEMVHVRQFECWGIFLLPVHVVVGWWLSLRGFDPHLDHPFEREAYERGGST